MFLIFSTFSGLQITSGWGFQFLQRGWGRGRREGTRRRRGRRRRRRIRNGLRQSDGILWKLERIDSINIKHYFNFKFKISNHFKQNTSRTKSGKLLFSSEIKLHRFIQLSIWFFCCWNFFSLVFLWYFIFLTFLFYLSDSI